MKVLMTMPEFIKKRKLVQYGFAVISFLFIVSSCSDKKGFNLPCFNRSTVNKRVLILIIK